MSAIRTGGCQCGSVRFRIEGPLGRASICHCRMCQKHFGSFFGAFVSTKPGQVQWTRTEPAYFQSSVNIDRGFCKNCGTPMTYRYHSGLDVAIGTFDDRSDLMPTIQLNYGSRLPWVEEIFKQEFRPLAEDIVQEEGVISFQHPDHDTQHWPMHGLKL